MKLSELPRNDVNAALAWFEGELDAGKNVRADDVQTLAMLQDDDGPFWDRLARCAAARAERGARLPEPDPVSAYHPLPGDAS